MFISFQNNAFAPWYDLQRSLVGDFGLFGGKGSQHYELMGLNIFYIFLFIGIILICIQIIQTLTSGSLFNWLLSYFDGTLVVFDSFLASLYDKMSQTHLLYFLPRPGISHFSKDPWLFLVGIGIRDHIVGPRLDFEMSDL